MKTQGQIYSFLVNNEVIEDADLIQLVDRATVVQERVFRAIQNKIQSYKNKSLVSVWTKQVKAGISEICAEFVIITLALQGPQPIKVLLERLLREESILGKIEWLRDEISNQRVISSTQLFDSITVLVNNGVGPNQESLLENICALACLLIDSINIKTQDNTQFRNKVSQICEENAWKDNSAATNIRMTSFGLHLLHTTFMEYNDTREHILNTCCSKISESPPPVAIFYVAFLAQVIKTSPNTVLQYTLILKEILQFVNYLEGSVAVGLLVCVWPLTKTSIEIQEEVMNCFREMMFNGDLKIQIIAVNSFLSITMDELKTCDQQQMQVDGMGDTGCSQSLSQIASLSTSTNVNLLTELLGFFRRCLKSTAPVRQVVYRGLMEIMQLDESCYESVAELLLQQFRKICSSEGGQFKLNLEQLSTMQGNQVRQLEATQDLFMTVNNLLSKSQAVTDDDNPIVQLRNLFYQLRDRTLRSRIEEFSVEANLDICSTKGVKNYIRLDACMGVLEVFLQSFVDECETNLQQEQADQIGRKIERSLELYQQLFDLALALTKSIDKNSNTNRQFFSNETVTCCFQPQSRPTALPPPIIKRLLKAVMSRGLISINTQQQNQNSCLNPNQNSSMVTPMRTPLRTPQQPRSSGRMDVDGGGGFEKISSTPQDRLAASNDFKGFVLRTALNYIREVKGGKYGTAIIAGTLNDESRLSPSLISAPQIAPYLLAGSRATLLKTTKSNQVSILAARCINELFQRCHSKAQVEHVLSKLPSQGTRLAMYTITSAQNVGDGDRKMEQMRKLVVRLANSQLRNEVQLVVEGISSASQYLSEQARLGISQWALDVGKFQDQQNSLPHQLGIEQVCIDDEVVSCSSSQLYIMHSGASDLQACSNVIIEAGKPGGGELSFIGKKTIKTLSFVINYLDDSLAQLEQLIKILKNLILSTNQSILHFADQQDAKIERENLQNAICSRFKQILCAITLLLCLPQLMNLNQNLLFSMCISLYQQLAAFAEVYKSKNCKHTTPIEKLQELVDTLNTNITQKIYDIVMNLDGHKETKKEHKNIPNLIYAIEKCEAIMLELGKLCNINLMRKVKRSINRDFKITLKKVKLNPQTTQLQNPQVTQLQQHQQQ